MVTVYAVASAKGGVGKTTTTAAIATILADSGADVVAIDADLGMANLAGAVGVTPGETTLHEVLSGRADPSDAVHDGPAGLRVVPGASELDAYAAADPSGLKKVIAAFDDADYVFVDAGAGLSHDSTLPLGLADETLLVSTAEQSALGDTEKTRQLTERLGGTVAGAAITRVSDGSDSDIVETLDTTVLGRIPEDDAVMRAVAANEPLPTFAPDAPATRAYRDLTRALTGAEIAGVGLDDGVAEGGEDERDETESEVDDSSDGSPDDSPDEDDVGRVEQEGQAESIGEAEPVEEEEPIEGTGSVEEVEQAEPAAEAEPETEPEVKAEPDDESTTIPDADGETDHDAEEADDGDTTGDTEDVDEEDTEDVDEEDTEDEDIIVAESERAGLGDPGDEEDIIVTAESPVQEGDKAEEGAAEPEETDNGIDGDTETVGEEHVDGDDLEAMIEADIGEEEAFDIEADPSTGGDNAADDEATDDEVTDDETTADEDTASFPETDIDDELAGSVPFRDDDTGGMNTALSEDDADDEGEGGEERKGGEKGENEKREENANKEEDSGDDSGGFFSRLLGR